MKNTIIDIFAIAILIVAILGIGIFIYNTISKEEENVLETMVENVPEVVIESDIENNIENNIEEEIDELIVKQYEIDGKVYEVIAVIYIPTLDIEYPVLSSTSKELLKVSVNKYWGPNPNRPGNFCIVGHNYNDEKFFGKLKDIRIGDYIQLTDMSGKGMQYCVYDTYIVNPDDTSCTSQLTNGQTEITLITCTKDFKQRFIVKARVEEI